MAAHFPKPPPAALRRLDAAWARLAASELPADMLSSDLENPLEAPWPPQGDGGLALHQPEVAAAAGAPLQMQQPADEGPEPMGLDGGGPEAADVAAGSSGGGSVFAEAGPGPADEGGVAGQRQLQEGQQAAEEQDAYAAVRDSLYRLLASQQMDLQVGEPVWAGACLAILPSWTVPCNSCSVVRAIDGHVHTAQRFMLTDSVDMSAVAGGYSS